MESTRVFFNSENKGLTQETPDLRVNPEIFFRNFLPGGPRVFFHLNANIRESPGGVFSEGFKRWGGEKD